MKRVVAGILSFVVLAAVACSQDTEVEQRSAALVDGSADAVGLLRFINDSATTFEILDDRVPLDRRAAENLIAARPFASVEDVDAVSYVGPVAMQRLMDYARSAGYVPEGDDVLGSYDGVTFTVNQAEAALRIVNEESEGVLSGEVDLDSRAINSIFAARPIASMPELAELYWVGPAMLERLRTYVDNFLPTDGERADCRYDGECGDGERCTGYVEQYGVNLGKCYPVNDPPGYWTQCSESDPCGPDLFCSGLTMWNVGFCSPMWMQDSFTNETQRYIPQDGSTVVTGVVVYGQASVPMDLVVDLDLRHDDPHALRITLLDPQGTDAVLWDGPNRGGQPFPSSFVALGNISRDDMVNGSWRLVVENLTGSGLGNLHSWQLWVTSRWD